jgi:GNAT superfamily N-acetyltransferase
MTVASPRLLPAVRVRAMTAEDAALLRLWSIAPEEFLRVEDLLACAEVPGAATLVGLDAEGRLVAVFQSVPAGCDGVGVRSVSLLVHPGRRRRGYGRATVLAALDEPCDARSVPLAIIDRDNTASLRCFEACGFVTDARAASQDYEVLVRRESPKPYFATARVAR